MPTTETGSASEFGLQKGPVKSLPLLCITRTHALFRRPEPYDLFISTRGKFLPITTPGEPIDCLLLFQVVIVILDNPLDIILVFVPFRLLVWNLLLTLGLPWRMSLTGRRRAANVV